MEGSGQGRRTGRGVNEGGEADKRMDKRIDGAGHAKEQTGADTRRICGRADGGGLAVRTGR